MPDPDARPSTGCLVAKIFEDHAIRRSNKLDADAYAAWIETNFLAPLRTADDAARTSQSQAADKEKRRESLRRAIRYAVVAAACAPSFIDADGEVCVTYFQGGGGWPSSKGKAGAPAPRRRGRASARKKARRKTPPRTARRR